ncbi:MAG: His/Gly/Thr/Pro-type tRNA ligase C-terminal domain-containing protein, partial [Pseudomonadota bacterium]|nr:His/Gly/Thr/Pro-type tRNA ligase C-terminal domain-containing protein [Pseudomonadota bacterium]
GELAANQAPVLAESLRDAIPGFKLISHCGGGSFKSQFKRADRSGARWTLILGEEEINNETVGVKTMATGEQETVNWYDLAAYLSQ